MDWIFLLVDHYNSSLGILSDEEFELERKEYLEHKAVKLKSKEHLHIIRIFQEVFGGLVHPTKKRYAVEDPRGGCVSCYFDFEIDELFCHLCDE